MMSEYKYVVNAYYEHAQATLQTDNLQDATDELMAHAVFGVHCDLSDGQTGQVYAIANHPAQFCEAEIAGAILCSLIKSAWGE